MNRKIFFSGISIIAALALTTGAAFAQFLVTATSNGSTFSSGNPALELCNDNAGVPYGCGTQIANPISISDLIPGVAKTFTFWLDNTGQDTLTPLTAQFTNPSFGGGLETDLNVALACDGNSGGANVSSDTFHNWETTKTLSGGTIASGIQSLCTLTVELPGTNTTDVNQSLSFNAVFNGSDGL